MYKTASTVQLADYQPYPFALDQVELDFTLNAAATLVEGRLSLRQLVPGQDLELDGLQLRLDGLWLDEQKLAPTDYRLSDTSLVLPAGLLEDKPGFTLRIKVDIRPAANLALEGLYQSNAMLCTQCEAQGFRRIMFYPDRPDVMSRFRVRMRGQADSYPVMLSNGNLVKQHFEGDQQVVCWEDPHPKPSYLFALVAGQLTRVADSFITASGRKVTLHIYVEPHNANKCDHAMRSLKNAMRWDEQTYGCEYDLDLFQIVATDNFNSGAMENKGLNIFNSECVLAHPDTTSDDDYLSIEAIVAHEYFHNWSGNRVTLRDWFQLSLKEGFTVFREHQFVASQHSASTKRVEEALLICTAQFAEDASPVRHPVRPSSYQQIRNFYTLTVYEKGAEVIRMLYTLLGEAAFLAGARHYFANYDGQAVRVEEFTHAMAESSGVQLDQFMRWYTQAGTPKVEVSLDYQPESRSCTLHLCQSMLHNPQATPLQIPVAVALFAADGTQQGQPRLLELKEPDQSFVFEGINAPPTPSLLRGFSAPVDLKYNYTDAQLHLLLAHESDGYSRWNAAKQLQSRALLAAIADWPNPSGYCRRELDTFYRTLLTSALDLPPGDIDGLALLCMLLALPSYAYLCEKQQTIAVEASWQSRALAIQHTGSQFAQSWHKLATAHQPDANYRVDFDQVVKRRLNMLARHFDEFARPTLNQGCWQRYVQANNMTLREQALETLVWHPDNSYREQALQHFLQRADDDPALINKWFEVQACIPQPATLELVQQLANHQLFDWHNPNKLRSLFGVFANRNPLAFHNPRGYAFFAEVLRKIDSYNPQVAARLATPFYRWRRYQSTLSTAMHSQLVRLSDASISSDLREGIAKSLQQN